MKHTFTLRVYKPTEPQVTYLADIPTPKLERAYEREMRTRYDDNPKPLAQFASETPEQVRDSILSWSYPPSAVIFTEPGVCHTNCRDVAWVLFLRKHPNMAKVPVTDYDLTNN